MHQTYSPHITTTMNNPQFPEHEHLNCPRCDSSNTKFCYYNNYNLSQPRHFCKNCRRYWTKGGTLRNIPVGGGTRKTTAKRASSSSKRPADSDSPATPSPPPPRDESKAEEMETETESSDLMKLDGENFESMLKSNQRVEFGPNLSNSPVTTPSPPEILGFRSDRMKLDGESFELTLKSNQRLQLGGFLDGLRPNLSAAESPAKTTPSPPPPRAESEAETLGILGYRSDQMKLDGESFKSMLKSNQRLQLGSFMDGLRPNLSAAHSISPVTTPSPPLPPPRAESKAETETLGILGYRSDRMKLDGESFQSMLKSNQRVEFGRFVDDLRPNLSGGSEEEGVIRTPANTGGSRRQFLSLNGDDNEGGGGRDGGNRWPNLSIFTPDSNLH